MVTKRLNVIVVGGSLGGLFAGIVLKRLGHNVRILERNPTPLLHNQGAGIVAGGESQAFFEKYDRTKTPIAITSPLRHYLEREGKEIHREEHEQKMTSWDLLYYLLRANFDGVQSEYCKVPPKDEREGEASYEYGNTVTGVKDDGRKGVEIAFRDKDGQEGTTSAELVIGADGPSSQVRQIFEPAIERTYAGYVAWRVRQDYAREQGPYWRTKGTIPETEASPSAREAFTEKFTFFHTTGVQILAYLIPGLHGTLHPGQRLINWVWYSNYPSSSTAFTSLMTDTSGKLHKTTLPVGSMSPSIWAAQKTYAHQILPPQFAELVSKTTNPFIQAITDVLSPRSSYLNGKVLLLGDAVAGFRPHTAASTNQAAYDALLLASMMKGSMTREEWERETMRYARQVQEHGVQMGDRSQFGNHPLASQMGCGVPLRGYDDVP